MRVKLQRTWFAPNGFRYKPFAGGVEVPDTFKDRLPSGAVVLDKDEQPVKRKKGEEPVALSQLASTLNPPGDPGASKT